jgi:hypothetical protein
MGFPTHQKEALHHLIKNLAKKSYKFSACKLTVETLTSSSPHPAKSKLWRVDRLTPSMHSVVIDHPAFKWVFPERYEIRI